MKKTAKGLVEYAKAQLGRPYWFGGYGQAASKALYNALKKLYPDKYTWEYDGTVAKVHDCGGLVKGYLWCDSPEDLTPVVNKAQELSANQIYAACTKVGYVEDIPEIPGVLVFYNGHMGVYIGSGEVIEARGHKYGVVKTRLADRPWKYWGYHPDIDYDAEPEKTAEVVSVTLPVLQKGDKSDVVRTMQNLLLSAGYVMKSGKTIYGADGSYGGATRRAVEAFQKDKKLTVTGKCDGEYAAFFLG